MDGDLFGKAMKTDPADAATLVIDSGVGGLSVLALARLQMPEENFIFFADAANAPYGDKQPEEIIRLIYDLLRKQAAAGKNNYGKGGIYERQNLFART